MERGVLLTGFGLNCYELGNVKTYCPCGWITFKVLDLCGHAGFGLRHTYCCRISLVFDNHARDL